MCSDIMCISSLPDPTLNYPVSDGIILIFCRYPSSEDQAIPDCDLDVFLRETAAMIVEQQSPRRLKLFSVLINPFLSANCKFHICMYMPTIIYLLLRHWTISKDLCVCVCVCVSIDCWKCALGSRN